ncbi:unnamed protein product [Brachionus calyciflorus]|uniref:Uncharacterized protein n=1 Tax=Brachionus calyciflorus TaxID=104777 RepID=A0A813M937_9BILA|nr:unnamed protein product [Brachionus calyciflorus]
MLKNFCLCSGKQNCTTSTASIQIKSKIIHNPKCKPNRFISSSTKTNSIKIEKRDNSCSDRSDSTDNFKYSEDNTSLSHSYPSSISNSIHFYHPKSIQSSHFTDMNSSKKHSSTSFLSTTEASEITMFSVLPSSSDSEKTKKSSLATKKRSLLSEHYPPVIFEQDPVDKNSNIQELKLLKKLNSYQFSLLKSKFNGKSIKRDKNECDKTQNQKSLKTVEKNLITEFPKINNADIYESIVDSNTLTKKTYTKSTSIENSKFQRDSLDSDESKKTELNETSISTDSFNKIIDVVGEKSPIKNLVEAVSCIRETYNNNLSGNEITYFSNQETKNSPVLESKNRSEFFITIEGFSPDSEEKKEQKVDNLSKIGTTKNFRRIKKTETRRRVRIDLKKEAELKSQEAFVKQISSDNYNTSKILENNNNNQTKTKNAIKTRQCSHTNKKGTFFQISLIELIAFE